MTLITAIFVSASIISISIFYSAICIQRSLYDACYKIVFAMETIQEKLNESENILSDILERLGGRVTIEQHMSRAGY